MKSQEQLRSTPDGIKSRMTWNHLIFSLDNIFDEKSGHIGIHHHFPLKFSVLFLRNGRLRAIFILKSI